MNNVEIATSYGSKLHDEALCDHLSEEDHDCLYKDLTDSEKAESDKKDHDQYIAMGFLRQADSRRYGMVLADLDNDYMKGDTNYPLDMPSAYRFLDEFKLDKSGRDSHERSSTHIAFVQGNSEPECYTCGLPGYTKFNCPRCNKQIQKKPLEANKNPKPRQCSFPNPHTRTTI